MTTTCTLPADMLWCELDIEYPGDPDDCPTTDGHIWLEHHNGVWTWETTYYGEPLMWRRATDDEVMAALFTALVNARNEAESAQKYVMLGQLVERVMRPHWKEAP